MTVSTQISQWAINLRSTCRERYRVLTLCATLNENTENFGWCCKEKLFISDNLEWKKWGKLPCIKILTKKTSKSSELTGFIGQSGHNIHWLQNKLIFSHTEIFIWIIRIYQLCKCKIPHLSNLHFNKYFDR